MKIVTRKDMKRLIKEGKHEGFNRQVKSRVLDKWEKGWLGVGMVQMLHEHKAGELSEPHYRISLLAPYYDDNEEHGEHSIQLIMDVKIATWDALDDC